MNAVAESGRMDEWLSGWRRNTIEGRICAKHRELLGDVDELAPWMLNPQAHTTALEELDDYEASVLNKHYDEWARPADDE